MKITLVPAAFALAIASIVTLPSCSESKKEEVSENIDQATAEVDAKMNETKDDLKRERDAFVADVNNRIEKNKQDIADLKAKSKDKKAEARKEYEEAIADLERRNDELKTKLENYKDETREGWQDFKQEFSRDMDDLGSSIRNLFKNNH